MFLKIVIFSLLLAVVLAAPTENFDRRIIGGIDNVLGEVPWAAALRTIDGVHFCTGSLINTWYVVTAAHCLAGRGSTSVRLVLGRTTLTGFTGLNRESFILIIHPNFNRTELLFDVGLVLMSTMVQFTATVQRILLTDTFTDGDLAAQLSGWGSTSQDLGPTSNNLRSLNTTTITNSECQSRHTSANAARIRDDNICTNNAYGEGFCSTGAGGPLVWNSQLIGIASWNVPCALGYPDVYVRVTEVRSWIMSHIGIQ